ncbi:hypothetical protein KKH23_07755 [Patescibacteria group bacterium]|nr:hypothetical protein [Patescibacteria group bacterium]
MELTKEKLEEYVAQLKQGKIGLDELTAGLIAVHGAVRDEMTPTEFFEHILSLEIPFNQIDMSDELRREFEAAKEKRLLKRLFARDIDYPAPERCPECDTILIGSWIYPFEDKIYESKYCTLCDVNVPNPEGGWSKWKPTPEDFYSEEQGDALQKSRERQLAGQKW